MTTPPQLASRVMKARRQTMCPVCQTPINVGDLIAKCNGLWMHADCTPRHRQQHPEETPA